MSKCYADLTVSCNTCCDISKTWKQNSESGFVAGFCFPPGLTDKCITREPCSFCPDLPVSQPSTIDLDLTSPRCTAERDVSRDLSPLPSPSPSGQYAGGKGTKRTTRPVSHWDGRVKKRHSCLRENRYFGNQHIDSYHIHISLTRLKGPGLAAEHPAPDVRPFQTLRDKTFYVTDRRNVRFSQFAIQRTTD